MNTSYWLLTVVKLGLKTVVLAITLIVVLFVSSIVAVEWWLDSVGSPSEFFVGVEFAYSGNVADLKALVDKVQGYTNLFVIGTIEISFNQSALDEASDYVTSAGLHLIVLFTDSYMYSYDIFDWIVEAKQKYGDKFLGIYRYDEPGGNQLDMGPSLLIESGTDYTNVAANYTHALSLLVDYYTNFSEKVFTADYGLYWFDYKSQYTAVFTEFGWNHSRPLHIGLCRGAANAHNKDWGAIVTWEYTHEPYLGSGEELFDDLVLAYRNGAKYAVVFSYPVIGPYGILTEQHFDAIKDFWNYIRSNPQEHDVIQGEIAYVLPQDYGFGFRSAEDKIWGLWEADNLSAKVWSDVNVLIDQYGSRLDVVYSDPDTWGAVKSRYGQLFFWNETIT
jgi:hypothetical protein